MIRVSGLSKTFGDTRAVDDLSFTVEPGQVTGFLGPNGSGKSTTMRMILGLDRPTAGFVSVDGKRYRDIPVPLTEVGALLEASSIHPGRSARNHLRYLADSNGIARSRVDEVLEQVGIASVARRRAGSFSLGMSQRLGIATALLGDPGTLMFDEPVNGLDPEGIIWIRTLLRAQAAEGRAVLVSSHLMAEMSLTADRLVVIGRGHLIADTTVSEFVAGARQQSVTVKAEDLAALQGALDGRDTDQGVSVQRQGETLQVSGLAPAEIGRRAFSAGVVLHELTPQMPTLEEAFMATTADSVDYRAGVVTAPAAGHAGAAATVGTGARSRGPARTPTAPVLAEVGRLVRSEWTKFFSLRSTLAALIATVAVCIAFGAIASYGTVTRWDTFSPIRKAFFDAAALGVGGIFFGQLVLGSLGVLAVTGEYSTGSIRATLAASPRRVRVLVAKIIVFGAAAFVVSVVTTLLSFTVTQWVLSGIDIQTSLTRPEVPRAVFGGAAFLVAVGLLGLGLGTVIRHTAGAISTLFGLLLVLPLLVNFLPDDWRDAINPYLPLTAGRSVTSVVVAWPGLSPYQALALVFGYATVALVLGGVVLVRRDA
jgi:ABC-2 type transport system ATP-binding protein